MAVLFGGSDDEAKKKREERARERRRGEVQRTLEAVAFALFGRFRKPWFRKPRALGRIDGREVEVIWLGRGRVEVRAVARETIDLAVSPAGWFQRVFGRATPSVSGATSALHADARRLAETGLDELSISHGHLVARSECRLDADLIVAAARRLMALAWADPARAPAAAPSVQVRPREAATPPGGNATSGNAAASEADLRCPFCHDAMGAIVVRCDACDAPHHPSCFEEGHGCSIAGCRHQRARGARVQA
jgi:hypothetical protein